MCQNDLIVIYPGKVCVNYVSYYETQQSHLKYFLCMCILSFLNILFANLLLLFLHQCFFFLKKENTNSIIIWKWESLKSPTHFKCVNKLNENVTNSLCYLYGSLTHCTFLIFHSNMIHLFIVLYWLLFNLHLSIYLSFLLSLSLSCYILVSLSRA